MQHIGLFSRIGGRGGCVSMSRGVVATDHLQARTVQALAWKSKNLLFTWVITRSYTSEHGNGQK